MPHQWPYQLPIFNHFTLLFLAMVFLLPFHLSTTLNLNVTLYLSRSLLFILSLLIPCYYKFVILSLSFYIYFPTQKWLFISLSLSLSLSLSHVLFLCEFFIFCISTLDWCIYVFFRVLLWVAIWFWAFKLLSFFLFYNCLMLFYCK